MFLFILLARCVTQQVVVWLVRVLAGIVAETVTEHSLNYETEGELHIPLDRAPEFQDTVTGSGK